MSLEITIGVLWTSEGRSERPIQNRKENAKNISDLISEDNDDPLAAPRGIMHGLLLSVPLWVIVVGLGLILAAAIKIILIVAAQTGW